VPSGAHSCTAPDTCPPLRGEARARSLCEPREPRPKAEGTERPCAGKPSPGVSARLCLDAPSLRRVSPPQGGLVLPLVRCSRPGGGPCSGECSPSRVVGRDPLPGGHAPHLAVSARRSAFTVRGRPRSLRASGVGNITFMALTRKKATTIALEPGMDALLTRAARERGRVSRGIRPAAARAGAGTVPEPSAAQGRWHREDAPSRARRRSRALH
jgi:hypothetical protein